MWGATWGLSLYSQGQCAYNPLFTLARVSNYISNGARSGIAAEAIKEGIPAIAFSGAGGTQHSFTEPDPVADLYAQVALKVVQAVTSSKPFLPAGVALVRLIGSPPLHTTLES